MKRFVSLAGALLLAGALVACGAGQGGESAPQTAVGSGAEQSFAPSEGEAPASSVPVQTSPAPRQMKELVFVQSDSGAEEGYEPTVRLLENGTFEFSAFCYDGTVRLTGTYTEEEDAYLLKPVATSAPEGAVGSELTEIRLEKAEGSVLYSGGSLGVTYDGAIFERAEE